jgi:hypothetical protein
VIGEILCFLEFFTFSANEHKNYSGVAEYVCLIAFDARKNLSLSAVHELSRMHDGIQKVDCCTAIGVYLFNKS